MSKSRLHQLSELGQSVWIDSLSREWLRTGELQRMLDEDAVVGVTSNQTIFQKAIGESGARRRVEAEEIDRAIVEAIRQKPDPAPQNLRELRIAAVVVADELVAPGHVTGNRVTAGRQA